MGSRSAAALVAAGGLFLGSLGVVGPAHADPTYPSAAQVERSKTAVVSTAAQVGRIEAQLASASARSAQLAIEVAQAVESYNGARFRLEQAVQDAVTAQHRADDARAAVDAARDGVGRFAAAAYRSGGDMSNVSAFLSADGPRDLVERVSALEAIGDSRRKALADMRSAEIHAGVLDQRAQEQVARQQDAAAAVEAAKAAAEGKLAAQQQAVAAMATQRRSLVVALASARNTSVRLERAREAGLDRARAARAAKAARERRAEQVRRARESAQHRPPRSGSGGHPSTGGSGGGGSSSGGTSGGTSSGGSSSGTRSGAAAAIAFARAQIGKPYVWAADGPDSFDCSGLTMRAWEHGGVSLPHYTVAQYDQSRKIPIGSLRPGDLVFFGSDPGNASSIYHVGLYIGGGQMIEAPYTGETVRISSIWRDSLFGAARP
jgi:peptidoglycan DL-endopeptidase CwlO